MNVDHDARCNITVLGAEPLIPGGDCTCSAMDPLAEFGQPSAVLAENLRNNLAALEAKLCERCGAITNQLDESSLMSRGRTIASWMLCRACRDTLRIEDLLDLVARRLDATDK
jgi:hypothetical protein